MKTVKLTNILTSTKLQINYNIHFWIDDLKLGTVTSTFT